MSLFAIVPAAGLSRRMGQPKLVMDLGGKTVIERLLTTLSLLSVDETVVVFRRGDEELTNVIKALGLPNVHTVQPDVDPPDMRRSVEHAVEALRGRYAPQTSDGWMLIPADYPVLDPSTLAELVAAWEATADDILIPQYGGKNGHPTFLRWGITERIQEIPDDQGLNWLRTATGISIRQVPVGSESILFDLDTPDDIQRVAQFIESSKRATPGS
jgi:molybdenum cofactor cytidylyltransferase